ncbi:hypothetical protein [Telluribacter humicola]|uniref:hypothetical protein n=1 Tax=Telluribacter humicola TaxID=1720261 RepID=UPI001A97675C|nr:hypothetical protein [Telluribacter humicola]
MKPIINSPELTYLSPTTRERALIIAQQLVTSQRLSPKEAVSMAISMAKNWAVKNVNRRVWKRLKSADKE